MNKRSFWLSTLGAVLVIAAAFVTVRSAVKATDPPPPIHPTPSAPEESATIIDDPTVAPDSAESADHNVSFPSDI